jgi:hypothetical protein
MISFDPNTQISTITIVGCGGTGAQVARIVARIVYDMRRARLHTPKLLLVDPDTVEEKNVGRQLFCVSEAILGLPKAEVVGKRLNMALGLDIAWCVEPFSAERHGSRYGSQLVIGCVDNHLVVSQSGCSGCSRGVGGFLTVGARFVSQWLHQPPLSLKVIAPKNQGALYVSLHV